MTVQTGRVPLHRLTAIPMIAMPQCAPSAELEPPPGSKSSTIRVQPRFGIEPPVWHVKLERRGTCETPSQRVPDRGVGPRIRFLSNGLGALSSFAAFGALITAENQPELSVMLASVSFGVGLGATGIDCTDVYMTGGNATGCFLDLVSLGNRGRRPDSRSVRSVKDCRGSNVRRFWSCRVQSRCCG